MTEERYFNTYVKIAWPARLVAPGLVVHVVPRSRKDYALTHVATGLALATSKNLDVLVQLASELTRRCEKLNYTSRNYVRKSIPESLTAYIMYVRKGGEQPYLRFCETNRYLPALVVREQTELSDILASEL